MKIASWIKKNKKEFFLLLAILLLASFLRLYKISAYMTFLGDEGRDALVLKRMIVDHKFRLIGPVTSIGNMYLGPLYYYLVLPSAAIASLSPAGPAVFVALLGVVTVGLLWWVGKEWFGKGVGLIAAFLYAISPVVIIYSRSSWNPNVMPFFALLTIYGLWRTWQEDEFYWLPVIGITLSFALQSHYLGLLLIPTMAVFWLVTLGKVRQEKKKLKPYLTHSLLLFIFFLLLTIAPLVWFDLRHNFINYKAFKEFFTVRQTTVNLKIYKGIPKFWTLITQVSSRLLAGKNDLWGNFIAVFLIFGVAWRIVKGSMNLGWQKFWRENQALVLVLVWILVGLAGLGNYKQHIYDHYFGFFFPAPFLLAGIVIERIRQWQKFGQVLAIVLVIFLTILAYQTNPLQQPPNNQLARTEKVARFIMEKAGGEPFNLALIAERNYDDAYAFFLERWQAPLVEIEPLRTEETITDQLFVICEKLPCQPVNHPQAEIAMFGWVKIDQQWELEGFEIYRLIPY